MSETAQTTQSSERAFVSQAETQPRPRLASNPSLEINEASVGHVPGEVTMDEKNFGLLRDVELNVLLRFGQRSLTLREVLDLKCGSVIELDRRVDEPVELLLDGRVIARGNAAIVDGNYGLQITEVL